MIEHISKILYFHLLHILTIFFALKMSSAFYICCIYSNALQTTLNSGSKQRNSLIWFHTVYRLPNCLSRHGSLKIILFFFVLLLYTQVNSYCHGGGVGGGTSYTYFRL